MQQQLLGTWTLESAHTQLPDGAVAQPFGAQCRGVLTLDAQCHLSAQIMRSNREPFACDALLEGTDDEIRSAFRGFLSVWGTYRVDEAAQQLIYRVDGSLYPNWIGTEQVRDVTLAGDVLTLRTPPLRVGVGESIATLVWRRR